MKKTIIAMLLLAWALPSMAALSPITITTNAAGRVIYNGGLEAFRSNINEIVETYVDVAAAATNSVQDSDPGVDISIVPGGGGEVGIYGLTVDLNNIYSAKSFISTDDTAPASADYLIRKGYADSTYALASLWAASNANFQTQLDAIDTTLNEDEIKSMLPYMASPVIASMSGFSTNISDWTTDTTVARLAASTNGMQMDYYQNGTLVFDGDTATLTCTNAGYNYLRMFVDARPLRGKRVNINIEGTAGTNASLNAQAWQFVNGSLDSDLNYVRLPAVSAGNSFAKQFQYTVSPAADQIYFGAAQDLALGDSLSITRLDISIVEGWEEQSIIGADRLTKTKAWLDDLERGVIGRFDVTLVGDSWTCNNRIEDRVFESFAKITRMDETGYIGWQTHGGGGGFVKPSHGSIDYGGTWENIHDQPSLDQSGVIAYGAGNTITNIALPYINGNIVNTHPKIYYDATKVGSFRWRTDQDTDGVGDGPWVQRTDWVTNTTTGAGSKWASFNQGFTSYYAKRVTIETLSGTNLFYGCRWERVDGQPYTYDGGFVFHKGGKSGGYMYDWADVSTGPYGTEQQTAISDASIDLLLLIIGTNDQYNYQSGPSVPENFYKDMMNYLDNARAAVGDDVDILLIVPPMNAARENSGPMYQYRNVFHAVAQKYDCALLNLIPVWGNDPEEYKYGTTKAYLDSSDSHPSAAGLDLIQGAIEKALGFDKFVALSNRADTVRVVKTSDYEISEDDWREAYGAEIYMNSSAGSTTNVITTPVVESHGMAFKVVNLGTDGLEVHEPAWSSPIVLDGTALDAGDRIRTTTQGAWAEFKFVSGFGWIATTDGNWIDGGP